MGYFITLSFQYMGKHKSRTLYSLFGIILIFILCFSTLTVGYSVWDYNLKALYENNGETQLFITSSTFHKEMLKQIENYASVKTLRILDIYDEAETLIPIEDIDEDTKYRLEIGLWDTSHLENSAQELQERFGIECRVDDDVALYLNQGDTLAANLYHVCVVLIASLFAVFSIFVLRNTMMISIVERMQEYGLFRCIGMSRKQLYQLLLTEGLILSICSVVVGVCCGYGLLSGLQPWLNQEFYFSVPFQFGFYPKAVLYTMLLCLAVTLFSLLEPARQAGMISPIESIHNNITLKNRKGGVKEKIQNRNGRVWGFFFGIEGEYAYKNMMRNRGKFIYLFIGLIVSVVLSGSMSSIVDSAYATIENLYQGQRQEFAENIITNATYSPELVEEILSDLSRMDGVTDQGIILTKVDVPLYDSHLSTLFPSPDHSYADALCLHYGYDETHFNRLKPYLLEGEISFEKLEKNHGVILCDTKYNVRDSEGNETDCRQTDYKVGDSISFLSTEGKIEAEALYEEAVLSARKKLGMENDQTDIDDLSYSKDKEHFDELLQEILKILKKKGFDCESIKKISDYNDIYGIESVLFQLEYDMGKRDEYVIQGIISEDIYNGSGTMEIGGNVISVLHPDTEILSALADIQENFSSFYYHWYIGFNRNIHELTDNVEEYCKEQSQNGITYHCNNIMDDSKNVMKILHVSKIITLLISLCIAAISMIQVFNTVCANMSLRKKELKIYSIIGMSRRQQQKMILLENGVAAILAVVIGYLLAWGLSWYFVEHLLNQDNSIHYIWPWFQMLIAGIVLVIATGIVSLLGMGRRDSY